MNESFFCKDKLLQDKVSFGMPNYKRMADWKKSVCMRGSAYLACASVNLCVLVSVCACECVCLWVCVLVSVHVCEWVWECVSLFEREWFWERMRKSGREITSNAQLTANFRLKISPEFLLILTNKFIRRIKLKFCDFYDENKKCHRCSKTFSSRKILAEIFLLFRSKVEAPKWSQSLTTSRCKWTVAQMLKNAAYCILLNESFIRLLIGIS